MITLRFFKGSELLNISNLNCNVKKVHDKINKFLDDVDCNEVSRAIKSDGIDIFVKEN
jgi:hypothetical protein